MSSRAAAKDQNQNIVNLVVSVVFIVAVFAPLPTKGKEDQAKLYPRNPASAFLTPESQKFVWISVQIMLSVAFARLMQYRAVTNESKFVKYLSVFLAFAVVALVKAYQIYMFDGEPDRAFVFISAAVILGAILLFTSYSIDMYAGVLVAPVIAYLGIILVDNVRIISSMSDTVFILNRTKKLVESATEPPSFAGSGSGSGSGSGVSYGSGIDYSEGSGIWGTGGSGSGMYEIDFEEEAVLPSQPLWTDGNGEEIVFVEDTTI